MRKTLLIAAGLTLVVGPACADPLPRYDIEPNCRSAMKPRRNMTDTPNGPAERYAACYDANQKAYDELKPIWETLKSFEQSECTKPYNAASYTNLLTCAKGALNQRRIAQEKLEREERLRQVPKREFRY